MTYSPTDAAGRFPDKVPGQHRWMALMGYALTEAEAAGQVTVNLGPERLTTHDVGCVDCDQPYGTPGPCPAGAAPELADVTGPPPRADVDVAPVAGDTAPAVAHVEDFRTGKRALLFEQVDAAAAATHPAGELVALLTVSGRVNRSTEHDEVRLIVAHEDLPGLIGHLGHVRRFLDAAAARDN